MVGSEINRWPEESRRQAIREAAFILADGDQLLGAGGANRVAHGFYPVREGLLPKQKEVVNLERVSPHVHAARHKFDFLGHGNRSLDRANRQIPRCRERSAIGISSAQPLIPAGQFNRIAVRTHGPQMLRNARLIDQIPSQIGNI